MIVRTTLKPDEPLSPEEIMALEALKGRPVVYDEDCPPSTPDQLAAFRRAAAKRNARLREAAQ